MTYIATILLLPNYIFTEIFNSKWITQIQKEGISK